MGNRGNTAAREFEKLAQGRARELGESAARTNIARMIGADYTAYVKAVNGTRPVSLDLVCDWIDAWNAAAGDTLRVRIGGAVAVERRSVDG